MAKYRKTDMQLIVEYYATNGMGYVDEKEGIYAYYQNGSHITLGQLELQIGLMGAAHLQYDMLISRLNLPTIPTIKRNKETKERKVTIYPPTF